MKTEPDIVIDTAESYEKLLRFALFEEEIRMWRKGEETVIRVDVPPTERTKVFNEEIEGLLEVYKQQVLDEEEAADTNNESSWML